MTKRTAVAITKDHLPPEIKYRRLQVKNKAAEVNISVFVSRLDAKDVYHLYATLSCFVWERFFSYMQARCDPVWSRLAAILEWDQGGRC